MTILAFLQNMWVKDPQRVKAFLEKNPDLRERMIRTFLFAGCLTGRRIKACFGEDLLQHMIFEETTREIAGDSRTIFPPEPDHIKACLDKYKPKVVLTFGKIATSALIDIWPGWIICCPHPAARQPDTIVQLRAAAAQIRELTNEYRIN